MKTTPKNSPTKTRLLDAAQNLVLTKGFAGTTVDDICDAAKLTKGSFFIILRARTNWALIF